MVRTLVPGACENEEESRQRCVRGIGTTENLPCSVLGGVDDESVPFIASTDHSLRL